MKFKFELDQAVRITHGPYKGEMASIERREEHGYRVQIWSTNGFADYPEWDLEEQEA